MSAPPDAELRAKLQALAPKLAPDAMGVADLNRLSGGASQETWTFRLMRRGAHETLVLRRAPEGRTQRDMAAGLETEAALIEAVARQGAPVPPLRYVLAPEDGLGRGFITGFIAGETIARKILRDAQFAGIRPQLPAQLGRILAAIHATPLDALPDLRPLGPRATLDLLQQQLDESGAPRPVFELALVWLRDRAPPEPKTLALVHGDFRNGNLIIGPEGVRAVLDWELAHSGDPMEDLGWLCAAPWRFGALEAPVGGLGRREDLFAGYQSAGGAPVDAERVHWWEVLASLRWGVICASTVSVFRSGADRSVERAMIARRASESEADLMRLMFLEG